MDTPDIRSLVPHSGPMVMLDRVIAADAESLCAEVRIRPDSLFCANGGVGAWVGLEYMAQAIGAYAGYTARLRGEPVKVGFLLGTRRYECSRPIFDLNSVLRVHVRQLFRGENGLASFDCRIDGEDEQLATATLTVYQPADENHFREAGST